jgi:hemerythrin-like domain-containing protein
MRHRNIKERGLEEKVKELCYLRGYNTTQIATELDLTYTEVYRFLRDDKLKNFSDEKLETIAMSDEFNPLNVISYYFQSVHHASKELAFTGILAELLRGKLAKIISEEGVEALTKGDNNELLQQWYELARKMGKLVEGAQKHMEGYINLFSQVIDVQREVSYVKVITEILKKEDPVLYKKIQRALDADPEAKRVLESLSNSDVMMYWDTETSSMRQRELLEVN